jgi:hypothetical protein
MHYCYVDSKAIIDQESTQEASYIAGNQGLVAQYVEPLVQFYKVVGSNPSLVIFYLNYLSNL